MKTAPVSILFERIGRILQNDAHRHGLKPTQWEALRFLARANRFSRNPGALTAYLGMTKGTVSQTLLALQKKELITKSADQKDKRAVKLSLTRQGRKLLETDPLQAIDETLDTDIESGLRQALAKTLLSMLEQRGGRPFGLCRTCIHFRADDSRGQPHFCGLLRESLSPEDSNSICVEQEYSVT